MKKIIAICAALLLGSVLFAQESSRKLIAGVYSLFMEPAADWEILDPRIISINQAEDQYVIDGGFVVKSMMSYVRYDFTCGIGKNGSDFDVVFSNMKSYASSKTGEKAKSAKEYATSDSVAKQYAKQFKAEIQNRLSNWSDEEYEAAYNHAVTSPAVLNIVANGSALAFKKFVSDNQLIGKEITLKINATLVDEAKKMRSGFEYYVGGKTAANWKAGEVGMRQVQYVSVAVFTNNDAVISLNPADALDTAFNGGQSGSEYIVKGKIQELKRKDTGGLALITIEE